MKYSAFRMISGDIMISVPRAAEQGAALGHSTERELMFLTVHGVLHLLGFDHMQPEDETVMLEHQPENNVRNCKTN